MSANWALISLGCIVAYACCFLLGDTVLCRYQKESRAYFAPVAGYAVYAYLFYWLLHITTQAWVVWGITGLLAGGSLFLFLRRKEYPGRLYAWGLLFVAGFAGYLAWVLAPEFKDGFYWLPAAAYDHVKAAMIPSMVQGGMPVQNPFGALPHYLHYYMLFYIPGACFKILTGAATYDAELLNTLLVGGLGMSTMLGIVSILRGKALARKDFAFCFLLTFTAACELNFSFLDPIVHGMDSFVKMAVWAPQNVISASFLLLAVVWVYQSRWQHKGILAFLLAVTMGASVYIALVGALGLGLLLLADWGGRRERWPVLWQGVQLGLLSLLLALPFIINQAGAMHDMFPVAVHIYPWSRHLHPLVAILGFWTVYYFLQMPVLFLLAVCAVTRAHIKKYQVFYVMIFASAFVTCFLKTVIDNNDLGWRSVLISIMLLVPLAACRLSTLSRPIQIGCVVLALALVNLSGSAWDKLEHFPAHQLKPLSAQSLAAIRHYVTEDDYFATTPLDWPGSNPYPGNLDFMLLTERRSCYASRGAVHAYCYYELRPLYLWMQKLFAGEFSQKDVEKLRQYQCSKFIFHQTDKNFDKDAALAAVGLRKVYQNEQIKIYE